MVITKLKRMVVAGLIIVLVSSTSVNSQGFGTLLRKHSLEPCIEAAGSEERAMYFLEKVINEQMRKNRISSFEDFLFRLDEEDRVEVLKVFGELCSLYAQIWQ